MFGLHAHPAFVQKFAATGRYPFLSRIRGSLSLGNASYYINTDGFRTRLFIHNYFQLLCDREMPMQWRIRVHRRDGSFHAERSGELTGLETEVFELSNIPDLDPYGVMRVHVTPRARDTFLPYTHVSMFYNECYREDSSVSIMAHNLHIPITSHGEHPHRRVSPGIAVPAGFTPYIFIAGGCGFHHWGHPACGSAYFTFVNQKGEERTVAAPDMRPLECHRLDVFAIDPKLREHVGDQPFILKVTGKNFLAKPFIYCTRGTTAFGEHL